MKKNIVLFKVIMMILAVVSLIPIWLAFDNGKFLSRGGEFESDNIGLFFYSLKFIFLSSLFIWCATRRVKNNGERQ
jgi:hypothetical protein